MSSFLVKKDTGSGWFHSKKVTAAQNFTHEVFGYFNKMKQTLVTSTLEMCFNSKPIECNVYSTQKKRKHFMMIEVFVRK
jgi:hypothetical protein